MICALLLFASVLSLWGLSNGRKTPLTCPSGWTGHGSNCYILRGQSASLAWSQAVWDCRNLSGRHRTNIQSVDLVSITSGDEQKYIFNQLVKPAKVKSVYLGLNSHLSSGGYRWSDNRSPVSYLNWEDGFSVAETARLGLGCVVMNGTTGSWSGVNCDEKAAYICKQIEPGSATNLTLEPVINGKYCPSDWLQYGSKCYKLYRNGKMYKESQHYCELKKGNLATINNLYEQSFLLAYIGQSDAWIGLNDQVKEGTYVWADGSNVTYTNWNFGEPNDAFGEDCVHLYSANGNWNDLACNSYRPYVCQREADQSVRPTSTPESNTVCSPGWISYDNHCYLFNYTATLNFADAENHCKASHAHLVRIDSVQENAFVISQWALNVRRIHSLTQTWIGLNMTTPGYYEWVDGGPVTFTSWFYYSVNNNWPHYHCIAMSPSAEFVTMAGSWFQTNCSRHYGFVCEKEASVNTTVTPTLSSHLNCSHGWKKQGNFCYKFDIPLRATWMNARARCQEYGADLVSIHSPKEESFIVSQFTDFTPGFTARYWIGLNDRYFERSFVWSDKSPVSYLNWRNHHPRRYSENTEFIGGIADCGLLYVSSTQGWSDKPCSFLHRFICKIPLGKAVSIPFLTEPPPYASYGCPADWAPFGPYCYLFVNGSKGWSDAESDCHQKSGNLTSVTSQREQEFLSTMINSTAFWWIGLKGSEGTFTWSDKSPVPVAYWPPSQPSGDAGKDCVGIFKQLYWSDAQCSMKNPYICKKPRPSYQVAKPAVPTAVSGACPLQWNSSTNGYCYLFPNTTSTWTDAEAHCQSQSPLAHLASVWTVTEKKWLKNLTRSLPVWTGLNDRLAEHLYVWSDSTPVFMTSWDRYNPSDAGGTKNCVVMENNSKGLYMWKDNACFNDHRFVCKMPSVLKDHKISCSTTLANCSNCGQVTCPSGCSASPVYGYQSYSAKSSICTAAVHSGALPLGGGQVQVIYLPGRSFYSAKGANKISSHSQGSSHSSFTFHLNVSYCDPGWIFNGFACYLIVGDLEIWDDALDSCGRRDGSLVDIGDKAEQTFLVSLLPREVDHAVWIGLNRRLSQNGSFAWTDNKKLTSGSYANWRHGQPDKSGSCVVMHSFGANSGQWDDQVCSSKLGYICEKRAKSAPAPRPLVNDALWTKCSHGWKTFNTSCYDVSLNANTTWALAEKACENSTGHLLSIGSPDEWDFVARWLKGFNYYRLWIGLGDQRNESVYKWSDGTPMAIHAGGGFKMPWGAGQPDDSNHAEDCVEINPYDGSYIDKPCSAQLPYVCETARSRVQQPPSSSGMSAGVVVGIVVGSLLLVVLVIVVVVACIRRRARKGPLYSRMEFDTSSEFRDDHEDDDDDDDDDAPLAMES